MVVGDLHGDTTAALGVIRSAVRHKVDLIVQVGDFGYWHGPSGDRFLYVLNRELGRASLDLWFVDGNHENHDRLHALPTDPETGRRSVREHIHHLPRGHRWLWGDTAWLAAGGAFSVDRHRGTEYVDWWPTETMSAAEVYMATQRRADVVIAHDAPWGTPYLAELYDQDVPPGARHRQPWPVDALHESDNHQRSLRCICDAVGATRVLHGHHHVRYDDLIVRDSQPSLHVTGLGMNGDGEDLWVIVDAAGRVLDPGTA